MPIVKIEMYAGFSAEYRQGILDSVHEALVFAFQIPLDDRNQILNEHDEAHFERSGGKSRQFLIIEIVAFKGRSRDAKKKLYRRIVANLGSRLAISPQDILITINEPELVNWGIAGGQCADEVDLGFRIDV